MMFTLLQTLQQWGINQHHWMTAFLNACAQNNGEAPEDLNPFLPWEMSEDRKLLLSQPLPTEPPPGTS